MEMKKGVGQAFEKGSGAVAHAMEDRIAAAVQRAGAPVLAEISDLKARLEDLTQKIEHLQTSRPEKPDRSET